MGLRSMIKWILSAPTDLVRKVDEVDDKSRQMRHKLNTMAMRSTALCQLVSKMREDEAWKRPRESNDKSA
jgi:aspartokinase-like uncharacterized kinase